MRRAVRSLMVQGLGLTARRTAADNDHHGALDPRDNVLSTDLHRLFAVDSLRPTLPRPLASIRAHRRTRGGSGPAPAV